MFKNIKTLILLPSISSLSILALSCSNNDNVSVDEKLKNDLSELLEWFDESKLKNASIEELDSIAENKWGPFGNTDAQILMQDRIPTFKYKSGTCFWLTALEKTAGEPAQYTLWLRVTQPNKMLPMPEKDIFKFETTEIYQADES